MADFLPAYEKMIVAEGGYVLHTVPGDRGGMTYAGIARNMNPQWKGWAHIDRGETPPTELVRSFYKDSFWNPVRGDEIKSNQIASSIFDFGVNAGWKTAAKLAQIVVGVTPDGSIGPKSVAALNSANPDLFVARYALAKLARYRDIVTKDRSQIKFLLGWVNRLLKGAA